MRSKCDRDRDLTLAGNARRIDHDQEIEALKADLATCRERAVRAEQERDEARESRFALIVENEQLVADLAACSERTVRLVDALERAEREARTVSDRDTSCCLCHASTDRPFGQVTADIPHRPTCPFWVLTAAARAALENANG